MIILLTATAQINEVQQFIKRLEWMGLRVSLQNSDGRMSLAVVSGLDKSVELKQFEAFPLVEKVMPFSNAFKLVGKDIQKERLVVKVNNASIGGEELMMMAGPCSVESEEQIHETAVAVAAAGATVLRGGAFKPRTSPYDFQGLGEEGLRYLADAGKANGLPVISEVMGVEDIDLMFDYVDIFQVGARNMQNFSLLKQLSVVDKPVMLKRGPSAIYKELLMAAEYLLDGGNHRVILCERGIRTFESYTRNTLDLAAVPILHSLSHLPVVADPSHGTGLRSMVTPMARAAVAAGADGIMVEVHPQPDTALSDGQQSLYPDQFVELMDALRVICSVVDKVIPEPRQATMS